MEKGDGDGDGQLGHQQKDEGDDHAAATFGMTFAESEGKGKGDERGELELSNTSEPSKAVDDDWQEDAPDGYICPLKMNLMTEAPVLDSDGSMYSKKGLELWIAHCAAKGLPLTSPRTGLPTETAFMLNMTRRTLVREWVEKCKEMGKKT